MPHTISNINQQIGHCEYCRLHKTRIKPVPGDGISPSKFMFIAQAPGRKEDEEGKILIGPSGKVFNDLLKTIRLSRDEIYVTNLLKCYLPKCRKPRSDEVSTCFELYLLKEIELVKPEIIVTMGYHVSKFIFKQYGLKIPGRIGFRQTFGSLLTAKNKKIVPVRHPATVVHESKQFSKLVKDYHILKTLKSNCSFIESCSQYQSFKKGLIAHNYIEMNCYGDWKNCKYNN